MSLGTDVGMGMGMGMNVHMGISSFSALNNIFTNFDVIGPNLCQKVTSQKIFL